MSHVPQRRSNTRYEVLLTGHGGQGVILAGVILAEAAAVYDGKHAAQLQSYGPAARGGVVRAEVVISDQPIDYPKVTAADLFLAMSQEAYDRYCGDVGHGGMVIVDSILVDRVPAPHADCVPITRIAEDATGRRVTANIVALGLVAGLTGIVSKDAVTSAVAARAPKGTAELNLKALRAGLHAAQRLR
jgi:2-oxoglutarate ferredoxin oxidoreductase subunit gamma